jgi:hypothetical protein
VRHQTGDRYPGQAMAESDHDASFDMMGMSAVNKNSNS